MLMTVHGPERLPQIGLEVGQVLEADREPDCGQSIARTAHGDAGRTGCPR